MPTASSTGGMKVTTIHDAWATVLTEQVGKRLARHGQAASGKQEYRAPWTSRGRRAERLEVFIDLLQPRPPGELQEDRREALVGGAGQPAQLLDRAPGDDAALLDDAD